MPPDAPVPPANSSSSRIAIGAAELGLESIVSKRVASRYRSGPSRSWLKTKNMVEGEFILLSTERDSDGVPWALLASDRDGRLEFCRPGHFEPATGAQSGFEGADGSIGGRQAAGAGLRQGSAQCLRPELRVRVKHLKARSVLRHATVKQLITDWIRFGNRARTHQTTKQW